MEKITRIQIANGSGLKAIRSAGTTAQGIMATGLLLLVISTAFAQDWTQTGAPTNEWKTIAASASGTKLLAAANGVSLIYASTNAGTNWNATSAPQKVWFALASSADGTTLLAVGSDYLYITNGPFSISLVLTFARIFTSTNSGVHWTQASGTPTDVTWISAAASADGRKLVAGTVSGGIYTSTNAGNTWTLSSAPKIQWSSVASSADGTKLVAVAVNAGIYTSADSGATWIPTSAPSAFRWKSVAASADGVKLVAAANFNAGGLGGPIYVSTDRGANWQPTSAPTNYWLQVTSSADGSTLVAVAPQTSSGGPDGGPVCISRDAGDTWTTTNAPSAYWYCVASSADGKRLFAGIQFGGIYTSQSTASPMLSLTAAASGTSISWIIPSADFILQENSDLSTTNWTDVSIQPTVVNYQNQVILSPQSGYHFYRLKSY